MKKRISLSTLILLLIAAILLTAMSSCALADSHYRDENGGAYVYVNIVPDSGTVYVTGFSAS